MTSLIAWLDASSEDQRRMREIVRLFSQQESRDELGIGQIRDALGDGLFPGTSTLHTRARYMVFIPWCFRVAAERNTDVAGLAAAVDRFERQLIGGIRDSREASANDLIGLIGVNAGESLKTLPSDLYWSALRTYGILTDGTMTHEDALAAEHARFRHRSQISADDDEPVAWQVGAWSPSLPAVPAGFPREVTGGFAMTADEAGWLQERMLQGAENTVLAHILDVGHRPIDSLAPWADPIMNDLDCEPRRLLEHARRFSFALHGAALLYNVLLADEYEKAGNTRNTEAANRHRPELERWGGDAFSFDDLRGWDLDDFWLRLHRQNPHIARPSLDFVRGWVRLLQRVDPATLVDNDEARRFIDSRERRHKRSQARLHNKALLSQWSGASGVGELTFRWSTVRTVIGDIHDGLERTDA